MEEKNKRERKPRERMSRQETLKVLIVVLAVILVLAVIALGILLNSEKTKQNTPALESTAPIVEQIQPTVETFRTLEIHYGSVQISEVVYDSFRHEEVIADGRIEEVFYMLQGNSQQELFRICFGDVERGDLIGYLRDGEELLPVTVLVNAAAADSITDKESEQTYTRMMDQINTILTSIRGFDNYTEEAPPASEPAQNQMVELSYWVVELPENVTWEEQTIADTYQADFYGTIDGQQYHLYTIFLGEENPEAVVGQYTADGMTRAVSIRSYDAGSQMAQLSDENVMTFGRMMDSVNTVLQVIMADENYSAVTSE